jgi:hypothetical protein
MVEHSLADVARNAHDRSIALTVLSIRRLPGVSGRETTLLKSGHGLRVFEGQGCAKVCSRHQSDKNVNEGGLQAGLHFRCPLLTMTDKDDEED